MNCHFCTQPLEGQPKTEQPCGCNSHTACVFRYLADQVWHFNQVICRNCNAAIYTAPPNPHTVQTQAAEERLNFLLQNVDFKKDLKVVKKANAKVKRSIAGYKRLITAQARTYKNIIQPIVNEIKQHQRTTKLAIQNSDEMRQFRRDRMCAVAHIGKLKRKYNLNRAELRELNFIAFPRYRFRRLGVKYLIARKLRVGL